MWEKYCLRPTQGTLSTSIPVFVYGTAWKKDRSADLVYTAIKAGFRAVDTAAQPRHYQENLVGDGIRRAIADGIVGRADLYVSGQFLFLIEIYCLEIWQLTIIRYKPSIVLSRHRSWPIYPMIRPRR